MSCDKEEEEEEEAQLKSSKLLNELSAIFLKSLSY
jgi:hypothetical protein